MFRATVPGASGQRGDGVRDRRAPLDIAKLLRSAEAPLKAILDNTSAYGRSPMPFVANQDIKDQLNELSRAVHHAREALAMKNPDRAEAILYQVERLISQTLRELTVVKILK